MKDLIKKILKEEFNPINPHPNKERFFFGKNIYLYVNLIP
jgi:hypothetical protein